MCALKGVGIYLVGKPARYAETSQYHKPSGEWIMTVISLPRKTSKLQMNATRTQTDTGSQGEYPKALE